MKLNGYGQIKTVSRVKSIENRILTEMNHVGRAIHQTDVPFLLYLYVHAAFYLPLKDDCNLPKH